MKIDSNLLKASVLKTLCEQHKRDCQDGNCGIVLFYMRELYKELIKRELTQEEELSFLEEGIKRCAFNA